jgi:hypothetical protein
VLGHGAGGDRAGTHRVHSLEAEARRVRRRYLNAEEYLREPWPDASRRLQVEQHTIGGVHTRNAEGGAINGRRHTISAMAQ